ncbi:MAG TPA: AraC family transcriptional regulator [Verrucomicrobiae bacterium]|nr:AraC family transcriptional regulator [Verrucomicrobiae bacterium]
MINLYEAIRANPGYSKLVIGDFLFAEYTCGVTEKLLPLWTETDYLVHVVTGKKTWHTPDGVWKVSPGETVFFKKGAAIAEQHFDHDVCLLMLFIPDALMRSTVREVIHALSLTASDPAPIKAALRVENDVALAAFFQSMRTYLAGKEKPPEPLVRLKLKELAVSILTSGTNSELAAYFRQIGATDSPSVAEIMEANFRYNLSLEEYAKLCHRSLSSFKREFQAHFNESPGKWLVQKRVEYASALLRGSPMNVTEIAFESGFEDVSHFSRVFKERFGTSPVVYRQESSVAA